MKFYLINPTQSNIEIEDIDFTFASGTTTNIWDKIPPFLLNRSEELVKIVLEGKLIGHNGLKILSIPETLKMLSIQESISADGKKLIRSDSRPIGTTTYFTTHGDGLEIGDGEAMFWDFSNSIGDISCPIGFKRKRIDIIFRDKVWLKEGTIYFTNKLKGSYISLAIVCPPGGFYLDRSGAIVIGPSNNDVVLNRYVNCHYMCGSVPMGDELNTEASSDGIPAGYIFRLEVTVPESDSTSHGFVEMELYRERTCFLPGETT